MENLLISAQELTTKIRAADIASAKQVAPLSPEEEEKAEESAAMQNDYGVPAANPGEPRFLYVSKISAEEERKALKDAFAKAKTRAAELSAIAGAELGTLRSVNGEQQQEANAEEMLDVFGNNEQQGYRYRAYMAQRMLGQDQQHEAVGMEPSTVATAFGVIVTFNLK